MSAVTLPHLPSEVLNKAYRISLPCLAQGHTVITTAQSNTVFFALHKTDLLLKLRINIFKWWVQMSSRILFHNFVLLNCAQVLYRRLSLYIIWWRLGNKSWSPCSSTKIKNSLDAFSKSVAFTLTAHTSTIKMITSLPNLHFLWS